jgi:hypothetical protein
LTNYTVVNSNIVSPAGAIAASVAATATNTTTATTTATTTITTPITAEVDWYTFQYRGGELPLTVWMDVEPFGDAEFTIVDAESAQGIMAGTALTPTTTIGSGLANPIQPGYLYWQAEFEEADTYFVMVEPSDEAAGDVLYAIYALGPGVGRVIEPVEE